MVSSVCDVCSFYQVEQMVFVVLIYSENLSKCLKGNKQNRSVLLLTYTVTEVFRFNFRTISKRFLNNFHCGTTHLNHKYLFHLLILYLTNPPPPLDHLNVVWQ